MTTFDISDTLAPNSDQLDAVDLLGGPQTFTISKVSKGNLEQPVQIHLAEFDRPWRPGKSMRRVMVACWGPDANQYVGRSIRLWCDPKVAFGGQDVGGVRILALSHIDKSRGIPLLVSRGKSATYKVDVLKVEAPKTVSIELLHELDAMFERKGIPADARLSGVNRITGGSATELEAITEDDAREVLRALQSRPDVAPALGGAA
jgi:hypothetical protein